MEPTQTVKFINLDEIPSPNVQQASPTPMVDETQPIIAIGMDIDMPKMGQGQQAKDTDNPSHPKHTEDAQRLNGTTPNQIGVVTPGRSHTTDLEKQHEGLVEDVTGQLEAYAHDKTMEDGTSIKPLQ
jgi:hypothetical protein